MELNNFFSLDSDESLRAQLSPATADPLNLLHIKANGCILYVEKVLDGVCEGFTALDDISEIPGTLNGLYLWLSQRLFPSKRAWEEELRPLINILLASEHLITISDLMEVAWTRNSKLNANEFAQRTQIIR